MQAERHMFPGNNTPLGFYSYYHHILPQKEANHIFSLKGGPGVGKSSMMKRIGKAMQQKGYAVEYYHCSSDPDSLDGVLIPAIRVAIVDGTAPHIIDPINPGAVDEIVNLGAYWDLGRIKQNKKQVIRVNGSVGLLFKRAYRYIAAAKLIMDDITAVFERAADSSGLAFETEAIISNIFSSHKVTQLGKARKQFASAITPSGIIHSLDTLFDNTYHVYKIKSHWGIGVNAMLKRISDAAILRGINTEQYLCPMDPENKMDHLIIPQLKLAFVTENKYITVSRYDDSTDLTPYLSHSYVDDSSAFIDADTEHFQAALDEAISTLKMAKQAHDDLEKYYIPHMDFEKLNDKIVEIIDRILEYSGQ